MKTILYAWEIGDGFGHIRNLVAIAQRLTQFDAVFALPDHQIKAIDYVKAAGFEAYTFRTPAPIILNWWLRPFAEYRAASFLDVLTCYAYDRQDRLRKLYGQVEFLLDTISPDVVIAESAPTFLLAARGKIRTLATGTSYGTPQRVNEVASSYPQLDDRPLTPLQSEEEMNDLLAGMFGPGRMEERFAADATLPLCYPEVDLYEAQRDPSSVGVGPISQYAPMEASGSQQFAYLSAKHPNIKRMIDAIRCTSMPTRIYVNGGESMHVAGRYITHLKSFDLAEELARCSRVIHHGSAGIMQAAMGAGLAQFVFPYHAENTQNVAKMWRLGNVNGCGYAEGVRYHQALVADYGVELGNARKVSEAIAARQSPGLDAVALRVETLLEKVDG